MSEIAAALELDGSLWTGDLNLASDLELDSLDLFELLCTTEGLAGCTFDDDLVVTWTTLDDVYRCYANNLGTLQ